jgi:hypothetical protein
MTQFAPLGYLNDHEAKTIYPDPEKVACPHSWYQVL